MPRATPPVLFQICPSLTANNSSLSGSCGTDWKSLHPEPRFPFEKISWTPAELIQRFQQRPWQPYPWIGFCQKSGFHQSLQLKDFSVLSFFLKNVNTLGPRISGLSLFLFTTSCKSVNSFLSSSQYLSNTI